MPATNPKCYHLSASSIGAFKACPQRFRLAYREGLRVCRDTESQRVGTNWHAMHEAYANALEAWKTDESESENAQRSDPDVYALAAVAALLDERYASPPGWVEAKDWALEREVLWRSFLGYLWYWQNDPVVFLASEVPFNLPLHNASGLPLRMDEVQRVGKIDHVIRWQGGVGALERKSTTRSIAADSDYWDKSKKDTQVSMYALAMQDLAYVGFIGSLRVDEIAPGRFGNTLYDVWHKPTIKPAMLTQAETRAFVESGEYEGEKFLVEQADSTSLPAGNFTVTVDGGCADVTPGKKGFAVRETIGMFGARLLADIYKRPDFYFVRREIARTADELKSFRRELYAVYQAQKSFERGNYWFSNEAQCRATFACPFIPVCYGPGADSVCDGKTTPDGFKRIFVDLTVNGKEVEE